ncbi:MAG: serine/threonine-protein kinase [Candidatus Eremiobacterota bacterium]
MKLLQSTLTYRIRRELASGGMGTVYEAEQFGEEGFSKRVALKVIHPHLAGCEEFARMFVGEARLAADLVHPNIVQIYHLGRADGLFIAMELVEGLTLRDFLDLHRGQSVPLDLASFLVSRVARALEYAHRKCDPAGRPLGVVHRDVSPNNVLISSEGEVKLADFGVAKAVHYLEGPEGDRVYGRVEYMSPEQASCRQTDPRSDVYSLGVVHCELLTGVNPFLGESLSDSLSRVLSPRPVSLRPDLPGDLAAILRRCLHPDPDKRFQSAGELAHAMEYCLYSRGYGPTIKTLADYLARLCPERSHRAG